jgi:hypothetical protein
MFLVRAKVSFNVSGKPHIVVVEESNQGRRGRRHPGVSGRGNTLSAVCDAGDCFSSAVCAAVIDHDDFDSRRNAC